MATSKKGGGAKTSRSESVTVRIDPRLRYLSEIAARSQRRTLSSYIEAVLADSLRSVELDNRVGGPSSIASAAHVLWHEDEIERLLKLRRFYRHLLTHEERRLASLAFEACTYSGIPKRAAAQVEFLREFWDLLKQAAAENEPFGSIKQHFPRPLTTELIDAEIGDHQDRIEELKRIRESFAEAEETRAMEAGMENPGDYLVPDDMLEEPSDVDRSPEQRALGKVKR